MLHYSTVHALTLYRQCYRADLGELLLLDCVLAGNLGALQSLLLYRNHFTGPIPNAIGNIIGLKKLALHSNKFTGAGLSLIHI